MFSLQCKKYAFYLINIDIDVVIFSKYRIDIVSKLKIWYRSSTSIYQTEEKVWRLCAFVVLIQYQNVTDRRTDVPYQYRAVRACWRATKTRRQRIRGYVDVIAVHIFTLTYLLHEKALREMQTLRAGCIKA